MNIDKNLLNQLASLDDAALAAAIKTFAKAGGINVGESIDVSKLSVLRASLLNATDADLTNAKKILEDFEGK